MAGHSHTGRFAISRLLLDLVLDDGAEGPRGEPLLHDDDLGPVVHDPGHLGLLLLGPVLPLEVIVVREVKVILLVLGVPRAERLVRLLALGLGLLDGRVLGLLDLELAPRRREVVLVDDPEPGAI